MRVVAAMEVTAEEMVAVLEVVVGVAAKDLVEEAVMEVVRKREMAKKVPARGQRVPCQTVHLVVGKAKEMRAEVPAAVMGMGTLAKDTAAEEKME